MQTCCSFKSAIEKSTKTMTEAQEKNHTDPINLSSRTPLGQLMRRAVTCTHQAGADRSTAPLPSIKKFSLFLGPPHTHTHTHTHNQNAQHSGLRFKPVTARNHINAKPFWPKTCMTSVRDKKRSVFSNYCKTTPIYKDVVNTQKIMYSLF